MFQNLKENLSTHSSELQQRLAGYFPNLFSKNTHAEVSDLTSRLLQGDTSQQQKFAAAFCYGCFTVFCFPLMSAWMVAFDQDVMYWFGTYVFWWTIPIPFGFIGVFYYHLRRGRLKRGVLLGSVIIPCVIFFLLGTSLRFKSERLRDHLLSIDCQTFPQMKELEDASKEATQLYDKCNPRDYDILFPACPDFKKWSKDTDNEKTWSYLQHLETNCLCTGFCKSGIKPIWTHTKEWSHDPCAMCVVSAIDAHIWRVGEQMMAEGLIILMVFLVWHFFMEPSLMNLSLNNFNEAGKEGQTVPNYIGYGSLSSQKPSPQVAFAAPRTPVSFRPARPVSSAQMLSPVPPQILVSSSVSWPSTLPSTPVDSTTPSQIPATVATVDGPVVRPRPRSRSPSMARTPTLVNQGVSMPPQMQSLPPPAQMTPRYLTM